MKINNVSRPNIRLSEKKNVTDIGNNTKHIILACSNIVWSRRIPRGKEIRDIQNIS